jgi:hypothetical protein
MGQILVGGLPLWRVKSSASSSATSQAMYKLTLSATCSMFEIRQTQSFEPSYNGGMKNALDIFRQLPDGAPLWVGTSPNLEEAKTRINQLASTLPSSYGVFDTRISAFVLPFDRNP